jgi:hypothetical protein
VPRALGLAPSGTLRSTPYEIGVIQVAPNGKGRTVSVSLFHCIPEAEGVSIDEGSQRGESPVVLDTAQVSLERRIGEMEGRKSFRLWMEALSGGVWAGVG